MNAFLLPKSLTMKPSARFLERYERSKKAAKERLNEEVNRSIDQLYELFLEEMQSTDSRDDTAAVHQPQFPSSQPLSSIVSLPNYTHLEMDLLSEEGSDDFAEPENDDPGIKIPNFSNNNVIGDKEETSNDDNVQSKDDSKELSGKKASTSNQSSSNIPIEHFEPISSDNSDSESEHNLIIDEGSQSEIKAENEQTNDSSTVNAVGPFSVSPSISQKRSEEIEEGEIPSKRMKMNLQTKNVHQMADKELNSVSNVLSKHGELEDRPINYQNNKPKSTVKDFKAKSLGTSTIKEPKLAKLKNPNEIIIKEEFPEMEAIEYLNSRSTQKAYSSFPSMSCQQMPLNSSNQVMVEDCWFDGRNYANYFRIIFLKCPVEKCNEKCSTTKMLNEHLVSRHGKNPIQCPAIGCKASFIDSNYLATHIAAAHCDQSKWNCSCCANINRLVGFPTAQLLIEHLLFVHQEGIFKCAQEGCSFNHRFRSNVSRHYAEAHLKKYREQQETVPTANFFAGKDQDMRFQSMVNKEVEQILLQKKMKQNQNAVQYHLNKREEEGVVSKYSGRSSSESSGDYNQQMQYNQQQNKPQQQMPHEKQFNQKFTTAYLFCLVDSCREKCPTLEDFNMHMFQQHGIGKFRCPLVQSCLASYNDINEMFPHYKSHSSIWPCYACPETFTSPIHLSQHIWGEHLKGSFDCAKPDCQVRSRTRGEALQHYNKYHRKPYPSTAAPPLSPIGTLQKKYREHSLKCTLKDCPEFFFTEEEMIRHLKWAHNLEAFICPAGDCDRSYAERSGLDRHVRFEHASLKKWICKECAHQEANHSALLTHQARNHHEGQFVCALDPYCKTVTKFRSEIKTHFDNAHISKRN